MEGRISAWKGLMAEGAPKSGMTYFSPATRPEELMVLAWYLEEGSQKFYSEVAQMVEDREAKDLFQDLASEEERHKASLLQLYREFSGATSDQGFPESVISPGREGDVMEGGMSVRDVLKWAKRKKLIDILELSLIGNAFLRSPSQNGTPGKRSTIRRGFSSLSKGRKGAPQKIKLIP